MIVLEAPGEEEDRRGEAAIGKTGRELDNYLSQVGLSRDRCYVTNLVKCRPPGNRDPKLTEIKNCEGRLLGEIASVKPMVISTLGRHSTRWFLGDVDMEAVHGIPFRTVVPGTDNPIVICPGYHPAYGLHDSRVMALIQADFRALADCVRGKLPLRTAGDDPDGGVTIDYHLIKDKLDLLRDIREGVGDNPTPLIALDTEWADGKPWCLTYSMSPGKAGMIRADNHECLGVFAGVVGGGKGKVTTVLHNALYDIPVLGAMGVVPDKFVCSMVMAYLLQSEPQGLKPLAFRHSGMTMRDYSEVVREATQEKVMEYLMVATGVEFPPPEPITVWQKGIAKLKHPQSINKKIVRMLNDYAKRPEEVDLWERWGHVKVDEGRGQVESVFGKCGQGHLGDVDFDTSLHYACRDADATYRLYPILEKRIDAFGLRGVLERDMGMMPMVLDMMRYGIKVDKGHFRSLSEEFKGNMAGILETVNVLAGIAGWEGGRVNPASSQQVGELLHKLGVFRRPAQSTDMNHLKIALSSKEVGVGSIEGEIIQNVIDYRGYAKLKGTYADVIPKLADESGRVHANIRITRVVTGRLSTADPNLMAQPVRTNDGRRFKMGYVADEGCVFLSSDYSQIEMRVLAHVSQDPVMMEIFRTGQDIHSMTASNMYGIALDRLDEMKHRYPAKRVGFGVVYGISAQGLLREMTASGAGGWTEKTCQDLIDRWFGIYKGVKAWMSEQRANARRYGFVRDMHGRVRLIPEVMSALSNVRGEGDRNACNAPIQMGAQGIIKEAMRRLVPVYKGVMAGGLVMRPIIQIHDDLMFEASEEGLEMIGGMVKSGMESAIELSVPVKVDQKVGRNWGEMEKWEKWMEKENR